MSFLQNVPQSWHDAAKSWRMTIEEFKKEADVLVGGFDDEICVDELVPLFNPYAALDSKAQKILRDAFPNEEEYQKGILELEKQSPKFSVAR